VSSDIDWIEIEFLRTKFSEARILFKAGKARDGYFDSKAFLQQVDHAINIFEERTNGFAVGLFLFDNAPSHQKRADDALSARKMPLNSKKGWTHHKDGAKMRSTTLQNGDIQHLYYPDDLPDNHPDAEMRGWFKGMKQILRECGLWHSGLIRECEGFKCPPGRTDCCCRRALFCRPDFVNQKSELEELIIRRGHLVDFYPKYHCEVNCIEMWWGAGKHIYRSLPPTSSMAEMEHRVVESLDSVPLLQIRRYTFTF
jgi:hypothetical protein